MLAGNMPELTALYLPSLTADPAPLEMQKSHNSATSAESYNEPPERLQQLMGISTPLKDWALWFVRLANNMQRENSDVFPW